ncbi:MAG: MmcQ/YjbR family DNA-binding protein [Clostridia bacterium]|nr:MmcQ/YjbR family DNA-binding protein [Clostridia bacterium]
MERAELFDLIRETYGIEGDNPFEGSPDATVFRHTNNRKWFALVMEIKRQSLGISGEGTIDAVNLKCDYILIHSLLNEKGIYPAYHMNKAHWITVVLNECDRDRLMGLVDVSYELTKQKSKRTKKSPL